MSVEKQAGAAPKVKKTAVPNHSAAFMIPMNRKKPVTRESYGNHRRLPSLETCSRRIACYVLRGLVKARRAVFTQHVPRTQASQNIRRKLRQLRPLALL